MVVDLDHMTNGMAVLEAVDQMTLDREPAPHLYKMLVGVLRTIGERSGPLVVPAFYWKLLAVEGVSPQLDACVRCGETETLVAFDLDEGGVLCRACRSGSAVSPEALALMRLVLGGRLNDALAVPASPATHEVSTLATRAMEHHIERRLRTVAMFEH
jgi:DNA repair protein RecO (recombination protein O)